MIFFATLGALLLAGIIYQTLASIRDAARFPAPGRFVAVNGRRMHVNVKGERGPVIVLEAGISSSSLSWAPMQQRLAARARVVTYDRAGYGWSDAMPGSRTPSTLATELKALLEAADVPPPYVFVAHSFGGLIARAFTHEHPDQTRGMVLVDALHENEWRSPTRMQRRVLQGGVLFSRIGALLAALGVVRLCLDLAQRGRRKAPKAVLGVFGSSATSLVERILGELRKLPPEVLPMIKAHWSRPKSFLTMSRYLAGLPNSSAEMERLRFPAGVPLIVLSSPREERLSDQRALAALCAITEHSIVEGCGHWIHLDRPELVAQAAERLAGIS